MTADTLAHGASRYANRGCRCDICRGAWADYNARRRAVRIEAYHAGRLGHEPTHGKVTTYNNYKCRCDECAAAYLDYCEARRLKAWSERGAL